MKRKNMMHRVIYCLIIASLIFLAFGSTNAFSDVIVDNGGPGTSYTGTWSVSGGLEPYGIDSYWAQNGATYTWLFDFQPSGTYEVLMWWTEASNRGPNNYVDINYTGGTETININQTQAGGQWNSLGAYYFDSSGSVTLTATSETRPEDRMYSSCADAVWFRFISDNITPTATIDSIAPNPANPGETVSFSGHGNDTDGTIVAYTWDSSIDGHLSDDASFSTASLSDGEHVITFSVQDDAGTWSAPVSQSLAYGYIPIEVVIDNGDPNTSYTGSWPVSGGADPYGTESLYSRDGDTYTWTFYPPVSSEYEVFMWWTYYSNRSDNVPVEIVHADGTDIVPINQLENASQWNSLGRYVFQAGSSYRVRITAQPGPDSTCADAVTFFSIESNTAPDATIDSISPNPADTGETVSFSGHGDDYDGTVAAYSWDSSIDAHLSDDASFSTDLLSDGEHTITFRVQDNEGRWSSAATETLTVGNMPPAAFIDSITPNPAEVGENVSFTGHGEDSDGSVTGYTWESSIDGPLSSDAFFTTSTLSVGDHTITLTVYDNDGDSSVPVTQVLPIEPMNVLPTAFIDTITPNPAEIGETVTFTGHGEDSDGSITGYSWESSIDGPLSLSSDPSFTTSTLSVGDHTITLTVYDDDGDSSAPVAEALSIEPLNVPPAAFIDSITPNPAEVGENVSFTGHGEDSDGSVTGYTWESSIDGVLSSDASFTTSTLSEGYHTISFKVMDNDGEWSSVVTQSLAVGNLPPSVFIDTITPNPAYIIDLVSFTGHGEDPDGSVTEYSWESSIDGVLSSDASFTTDALSVGTHTITLTVLDNQGEPSDPVTEVLIIEDIPEEVVIDNDDEPGTSSIGTWNVSSAPDPYGDNSLYSRDGATYTWTFSPIVSSDYQVYMWWTQYSNRSANIPVRIEHAEGTGADTVYIDQQQNGGQWNILGQYYLESGSSYRVTITAQPGPSSTCADAVRFLKIPSDIPPVADFSTDRTVGASPCTIRIYDATMGRVTQRLWDFGDGETSTEQNPPPHVYTEEGYYAISLTVFNDYGFDTKTEYIQVVPAAENIYITEGFGAPYTHSDSVGRVIQSIGGVENNGVWTYTNNAKGITYFIHFIDNKEDWEQALKEEGSHVIYAGHSNYGTGGAFPNDGAYLRHNIRYVDDDLFFNCSSDFFDVTVAGLKYSQAYPYWEPIYSSNFESAIAPYDFGDPRGNPAYNYYLTYTIPGDPTHYRMEQSDGSFMERFPDARPPWYSPEGLPPDPIENPEHFIINPNPEFDHCEIVGTKWIYSSLDNDNKEFRGYNYHRHGGGGSGANRAVWTLVVNDPGDYIAYASWQPDSGNASNAKYVIQHAAGETTVEVDQREAGRRSDVAVEIYDGETLLDTVIVNQSNNGGYWNVLGTYLFSGTARLVITSQGPKTTSADAARFAISPDEYIVDNGDAGTSATGTWRVSSAPSPYNDSSLYSNDDEATYTFEAAVDGLCEVSLWWTAYSSWYKYLGEFYFDEGVYTVQLGDNASGTIIADTVNLSYTGDYTQTEFRADVTSGTAPLTVQFEDLSSVSEDIIEWHWDFGDGEESYEENPVHEYWAAGIYPVSLTIMDSLGNVDTEVKEAFVIVDSDAPLHAEFTSTNRRTSRARFINQSSGDITEYLWDFGDGQTSTAQNPYHRYYTRGIYTVTLTVYGPGGTTHTEVEEDFFTNSPRASADNQDEYKSHFEGVRYGNKVILDASPIKDITAEECKFSRMFYNTCFSGKYFIDTFHRGRLFYTTWNSSFPDPVPGYIKRYLQGDTDEELLDYMNSLYPGLYEYYNFDLLPPSMR